MSAGRIIAGPRAVGEALRGGASDVALVLVDPAGNRALQALAEEARRRRVRVEPREGHRLDALASGVKHQGVIAIAGPYPYVTLAQMLAEAPSAPLLVALDQVTDPHNFGAIVRTAVALGVDGVLTLQRRAVAVTPAVVRASVGATEHARIARVTNLAKTLAELSQRGLSTVGLAADGAIAISALPSAPAGRVIVIGSEDRGLRRLVRARCDVVARIDLPGPISSLNASVAGAIALYEASRRRRA